MKRWISATAAAGLLAVAGLAAATAPGGSPTMGGAASGSAPGTASGSALGTASGSAPGGSPATGGGAAAAPRPRLVVLISIDQFRADYLTRFADLYLPAEVDGRRGGFRYLMERGAWFADAHHDHFPLYTGPGHSVLLTGAPPYESGIVGNSWYDRDGEKATRYCVEDPASPLVGLPAAAAATPDAAGAPGAPGKAAMAAPARGGVSPVTLRVSTVGDELKMATGGRAKVWGLSFKDRAAVLLAGHLADGVLWLDEKSGAWITSRYYRPDGTLPAWVASLNAEHRMDAWFGTTWEPSVPAAALARAWTPDGRHAEDPGHLGRRFPHRVDGGAEHPDARFRAAFVTTPFGNDFVLRTAGDLVAHEALGGGSTPDLLAINLASNDYIGHAYGPDSPEVLDAAVRTDRQLAAFFATLDRTVPGGMAGVLVVVTADHGVSPLPGALIDAHMPGGLLDEHALRAAAAAALAAAYGPGEWVQALVESNLYLDLAALDAHHIPRAAAEERAAEALAAQPGIYAAYTRSAILGGRLPSTAIAARLARSFHPRVSGDVVLIPDPYWMPGSDRGTTHGSPYAYDTSVPLLFAGPGVRPGRYTERASTLDVAPTLADRLGILQPSGSEGRVLAPVAGGGR
jgi:predicted AlkP superfamily pyrophosphatase or phosphodiesterase